MVLANSSSLFLTMTYSTLTTAHVSSDNESGRGNEGHLLLHNFSNGGIDLLAYPIQVRESVAIDSLTVHGPTRVMIDLLQ